MLLTKSPKTLPNLNRQKFTSDANAVREKIAASGGISDATIDEAVTWARSHIYSNDTDYLNSIPGMKEKIKRGRETPISNCFEIKVTKEMLKI